MPKYYKFSDLDDLTMQDVVNIRENARQLQRGTYFKGMGIMNVFGTEIVVILLERLGIFKGGKYRVYVTGRVVDSHIATSKRDLYNYLVGVMIKAHIYRFNNYFDFSDYNDILL